MKDFISKKNLTWSKISIVCPFIGLILATIGVIAVMLLSGGNEGAYWISISIVFYIWFPIILVLGVISACLDILRQPSKSRMAYAALVLNIYLLAINLYLVSPKVQFIYQKSLANVGFIDAQYETGTRYILGIGVKEDDSKGLKWIERAAEAGHVRAQFDLGHIYGGTYSDIGLSLELRNDQIAKKWFQMCASTYGKNKSKMDNNLAFNARLRLRDFDK